MDDITIEEVVIIPTGGEIKQGIVLDTNSPKLMELILKKWPDCKVIRTPPPEDDISAIQKEVKKWGKCKGIIFITGGAGGGKKFNSGLTVDCTHVAVLELIQNAESVEIHGSNGHLLAKIVVGKYEEKVIITLPGPTVEAVSGAKAALKVLDKGLLDCKVIAFEVADAIFSQYPQKEKILNQY
ncbi:molybdopterin-binding protein [Carboxydothermus hydrogenoformans]|uniref:Probable molybdopterin binding domain protein n=1 Tax=Carboxydothermus hydrogenoformans (strain ATCC BAA-161 / DSM 6008 / Z-2901) TaxID=246194 RepID=Q3ACJ1_CARHZ|nr:molybdopterin-binding protein [Carboxydothermus hydrogenoformans]ABB15061.1 probable molybdopterin binding domain protein [Carboxydothermus hydrogenoformans Z-2901]